MRLLKEANEVGEEDLGEFHKKIYGCGPLPGPLGEKPVRSGTSAPLPELEDNQPGLLWDIEGAASWDFSPAALGWGELVGIKKMWPTAPGPHLVSVSTSSGDSPTL